MTLALFFRRGGSNSRYRWLNFNILFSQGLCGVSDDVTYPLFTADIDQFYMSDVIEQKNKQTNESATKRLKKFEILSFNEKVEKYTKLIELLEREI